MNEVYLITNKINGKQYVGVTCRGYQARFKEHVQAAINGSRTILHNAIRKYGFENFKVELIESNISDADIGDKERFYIDKYQTFYLHRTGYNMTTGGGGVVDYRHSASTLQKISNSLKGHKFPKSRNNKIREAMTGRDYKPEWRAALSASRKGRFKQEDNPFFGKHHDESTKEAIRTANTKYIIICIDPHTNKCIQIFRNAPAAGEWVVFQGYSSAKPATCAVRITEVARSSNRLCTAYGFHWMIEKGQSTNCRVGDELPPEAQTIVEQHDNDIVSAT